MEWRKLRCKQVFGALLAALLLSPVPAFAWTLGTWSFITGGNPLGWSTPVGSGTGGLTLDFTPSPSSGPTNATVAFSATIIGNVSTNTANATFSNFDSIVLTAGTVTINVSVAKASNHSVDGRINNTNQFTFPTTVDGTLGGGTAQAIPTGSTREILVEIIFSNNAQWTTTSSSAHTVFNN